MLEGISPLPDVAQLLFERIELPAVTTQSPDARGAETSVLRISVRRNALLPHDRGYLGADGAESPFPANVFFR